MDSSQESGQARQSQPTLEEHSEGRVAVNAGSRYLGMMLGVAVRFVLTPFLKNTIGPALLGLQILAGHALQFIGLASGAIGSGYNRYATVHYARGEYGAMNAVLSVGFLLSAASALLFAGGTVIAAVFAGSLFDLAPDVLPTARVVIAISGSASAVLILTGVWTAPIFASQRFYLASVGSAICAVGQAVAVWIAFRLGRPSIVVWVLIVTVFQVGVQLCFIIPLCRRAVPSMRIRLFHPEAQAHWRGMVGFSGFSFLGGLGYLIYNASDSIVISNLNELGHAQIFFYNVAQRWDPMIYTAIMSFATTLTPIMTADVASGNRLRLSNTLLRGTRYSLILGLFPCIVLAMYADPFMRYWLGPEFAEASAPVMRLILAGLAVSIPGMVAFQLLVAAARIGGAVTMGLVCAVLNICLSIAFVKVFGLGLVGVALGTVLTLVATNAVYVPFRAARIAELKPHAYLAGGYARPLLAAVPLIPLCLALQRAWAPGSLAAVFTQFLACGVVYAASSWFVALTAADRAKVLDALSTIRARLARPQTG